MPSLSGCHQRPRRVRTEDDIAGSYTRPQALAAPSWLIGDHPPRPTG
jgi:hypothetical protein